MKIFVVEALTALKEKREDMLVLMGQDLAYIKEFVYRINKTMFYNSASYLFVFILCKNQY